MSQRERARAERAALDRLRERIVSGLHSGHLDPGDRLPSYRELGRRTDLDLRAASRIFSTLENERLVEVRGRQGVYVAAQDRIALRVPAGTPRWMVEVLRDGWSRRTAVPSFPGLAEACIATRVIRCACIEATDDQVQALCTELRTDFGFETQAVRADRVLPSNGTPAPAAPPEVVDADVLVSTLYQAQALRPIAAALGKPLVCVRWRSSTATCSALPVRCSRKSSPACRCWATTPSSARASSRRGPAGGNVAARGSRAGRARAGLERAQPPLSVLSDQVPKRSAIENIASASFIVAT
jgi:hypothetical protein